MYTIPIPAPLHDIQFPDGEKRVHPGGCERCSSETCMDLAPRLSGESAEREEAARKLLPYYQTGVAKLWRLTEAGNMIYSLPPTERHESERKRPAGT
jgi:hypothetical protein